MHVKLVAFGQNTGVRTPAASFHSHAQGGYSLYVALATSTELPFPQLSVAWLGLLTLPLKQQIWDCASVSPPASLINSSLLALSQAMHDMCLHRKLPSWTGKCWGLLSEPRTYHTHHTGQTSLPPDLFASTHPQSRGLTPRDSSLHSPALWRRYHPPLSWLLKLSHRPHRSHFSSQKLAG